MEINKPLKTKTPAQPFNPISINRCQQCGSVFITDKECEGCGFQFGKDHLGEPFGEQSYYTLKDDYFHGYSKFSLILLSLGYLQNTKKMKKYQRILERRLDVLIEYLFTKLDVDKERRRLFLFETTELIQELILSGFQAEKIWIKIEDYDRHPFFSKVSSSIKSSYGEYQNKETPIKHFMNMQIGGLLSVGFVMRAIFASFVVIVSSYLFFKYLVISS